MKQHYRIYVVAVLLTVLAVDGYASGKQKAAPTHPEPFPVFNSIRPAVAFWKKIFTKYSTSQGVIHDRVHPQIIYGVVNLEPIESPGSGPVNQKRIEAAKNYYTAVLQKLSSGAAPSNSMEKRVAGFFGPNARSADYRAAAENLRFQLGQQDRFRQGLIRSGAYLDQIKAIFRQYGLPQDLAYLPHVESSFNYEAYSKFGAAGIWQFTYATGSNYMTIDYTLDERRDPIRATHAAARFLKHNYEVLGSWPLAITAYNHGTQGMARAKQSVGGGGYEAVYNHYNGSRFGFASRNFYPEFVAAVEIARNVSKYFPNLQISRPLQTTEVELPYYVDLMDLSAHLKVDPEKLIQLNPALRKPVHQGQKYIPKGYWLRLPKGECQKLMAGLPTGLCRANQKPSKFYTVQRGDTAGKIARMHQVTLADLIQANQLTRNAGIVIGQNLRIPASGERLRAASARMKALQMEIKSEAKSISPNSSVELAKAETEISAKAPTVSAKKETGSEKSGEPAKTVAAAVTPEKPAASQVALSSSISAVPEKIESPAPVVPKSTVAMASANTMTSPNITVKPAVVPSAQAEPVAPPVTPQKSIAVAVNLPKATPAIVSQADLPKEIDNTENVIPHSSVNPEVAESILNSTQSAAPSSAQPVSQPAAATVETIGEKPAEEQDAILAMVNPEVVTGNLRVERVSKEKGQAIGYIRVEVEETLGHYAEWLKVPTAQIRRLNGFSFNRQIQAQETIKIPFDKVNREMFEERRYEYHKEIEEDFFSAYSVVQINDHVIQNGQNLWGLCIDQFDLPLWLVKKYNPSKDLINLKIGNTIKVPQVVKVARPDRSEQVEG